MTKKIISYSLIVLFLGLMVYLYYRNKRTENPQSLAFPLKKGSTGTEVKKVQTWLNKQLTQLTPLAVDGVWGDLTDERAFLILGKREINEVFYNLNIK
ncbi:MAG: hypothetical protein WC389_18265 [Lutibacter sp.]|jgi:cbb3-type cytochrome oxidase subunit 3